MSWLFSQALVAEYSAAPCSAGAPSAPSKTTPTPQAFWSPDRTTDYSRPSRFGMTFGPLTDGLGVDLLTWFRAASRARTFQPPARAPESAAPAPACGDTWRELSVRYDRATSSWRTHRSLWDEDLSACSLTLPKWGSMRAGVLSERMTSALPTGATVAGLWPKTRANDAEKRGNFDVTNPRNGLPAAVKAWPTPTASLGTKGGRVTPRKGREGGTLIEAVRARNIWPTPTASDHRNRGKLADPCIQRRLAMGKQIGLGMAAGGQLNPTWVEWLMGWPLGWTDLQPLATDRFRSWLQQHGGC